MRHSIQSYGVGPLLYCPANSKSIASSLISQKFGFHFSLALCLEDTIRDDCVTEAEHILIQTLHQLLAAKEKHSFFIPQIFIRVREPKQMQRLYEQFKNTSSLVTGFLLPKFCLESADAYIQSLLAINKKSGSDFFIMPILESPTMIHLQNRYSILYNLKEKLDRISELVLNIRVGGNDLCHAFALRRHSDESIHNIRPVANLLSDILTVFSMEYVVSGPVWEYYNGDHWAEGFLNELREDRLNGFIGKTVIHPKQIDLVNQAYQVTKQDYDDALSILNWENDAASLVSGSNSKERMNECKTHWKWAEKTLLLSEVYGICQSNIPVSSHRASCKFTHSISIK